MAATAAVYGAYAMYAATALAAAGAAYSAYSSRQTAKAQAQQAEQNANMAESQGRVEASRIRELGKKQASAARVQAAANGLDLNADNTVVEVIDDDITKNSAKDAWTTFFNSKNSGAQYRADANNYQSQATNATVGGVINVGSSLLSAYGSMPNGSKTTHKSSNKISPKALAMDTSRIKNSPTGWA